MDNRKIGELIAKLRKEKGLTQQELGDKVNVGSRAVSKWECGTTIPDISIINELSEILGISSNELLAGKLKPKKEISSKPKLNNKLKIFLFTFLIILIGTITTLIYNKNNENYTYNIVEVDHEKYQIEGHLTYKNQEITIYINEFTLNNNKLRQIEIKNYQYNIILNDEYLFGYGQNNNDVSAHKTYTMDDIENAIKNSYTKTIKTSKEKLLKQKISVELKIIDIKNDNYHYNIELLIYKKRK